MVGWIVWSLVFAFLVFGMLAMCGKAATNGHRLSVLTTGTMAVCFALGLALVFPFDLSPWHALWLPIPAWLAATIFSRVVVVVTGNERWQ